MPCSSGSLHIGAIPSAESQLGKGALQTTCTDGSCKQEPLLTNIGHQSGIGPALRISESNFSWPPGRDCVRVPNPDGNDSWLRYAYHHGGQLSLRPSNQKADADTMDQ